MINKNCYVCDFPIVYSRTRTKKYYCEKHDVCATEKTKILKKRGRKILSEEEKLLRLKERKERLKIYNKFYYKNFVLSNKRNKDKNFQSKKSTHEVI